MIPSLGIVGAVNIMDTDKAKARRAILAHDASAIDIIEILGLEGAIS